jgi:hypothetical protein
MVEEVVGGDGVVEEDHMQGGSQGRIEGKSFTMACMRKTSTMAARGGGVG